LPRDYFTTADKHFIRHESVDILWIMATAAGRFMRSHVLLAPFGAPELQGIGCENLCKFA